MSDPITTCTQNLQKVFAEAKKIYPNMKCICGHRTQAEQDKSFAEGKSKVKWPDGKHNKLPSEAFDAVPTPVDWNNIEEFRKMNKAIMDSAAKLGIKIRSGSDFNMNGKEDDKFMDRPHFEEV